MPPLIENYRRLLGYKALSMLYLAPILYLAAFLFCLTLSAAAPRLPQRRVLGSVGRLSYQLYLLHIPFFMTLGTIGLIELNSYRSLIYVLLCSPVLLGVCFSLNYGNERLRQGLGAKLFADW